MPIIQYVVTVLYITENFTQSVNRGGIKFNLGLYITVEHTAVRKAQDFDLKQVLLSPEPMAYRNPQAPEVNRYHLG
jgi:hypothetical protein